MSGNFDDHHSTATLTQSNIPVTPEASTQPKKALTTVKTIRANLSNGKPVNLHFHNLTVHINIYKENEACVGYIKRRVREEMRNDSLVLVGSNGLVFYDQEGTRGKKVNSQPAQYLNRFKRFLDT